MKTLRDELYEYLNSYRNITFSYAEDMATHIEQIVDIRLAVKDKRIAELETQLSDIREGLDKLGKTIEEARML